MTDRNPVQSQGAETMVAKAFRRPEFIVFPAIAFSIGRHLLFAESVELIVPITGVILAAGCALGLNAERIAPYAFGLPGIADGPPPSSNISPRIYPIVSSIAAGLFLLLQLLEVAGRASLILTVVAATAWIVASDPVLRRVWQSRRIIRALRAYAPTIGLGFAGGSGGPWQLRMWEPYLLRSGERCVIYNVNEQYADMILAGGELQSPFIQLGTDFEADLDDVLVPGLRGLFYVQNAQRNAAFLAHRGITHVWLNHGDSDKPANFNPRHAAYDRLVVCGQAGIDRYANHGIDIPSDKFDVLGRPQTGAINTVEFPIARIGQPVVLYAPTWQGVEDAINFSSLSRATRIVGALIAHEATVIFRPHPLSHRWRNRRLIIENVQEILREDYERSGRQHVFGDAAEKDRSVADCANQADALISDVSSVVSDFLQSGKPYAMISMHAGIEDFRTEFPLAQAGYVITRDLENLDRMLDDLLGADPLAPARAARKRYVLGEFTGEESADAFAAYVRGLVHPPPDRVVSTSLPKASAGPTETLDPCAYTSRPITPDTNSKPTC